MYSCLQNDMRIDILTCWEIWKSDKLANAAPTSRPVRWWRIALPEDGIGLASPAEPTPLHFPNPCNIIDSHIILQPAVIGRSLSLCLYLTRVIE